MSVNRLRRHWTGVWAILALFVLTASQCATAALISVNTTTDEFGENPGACGLREAIQAQYFGTPAEPLAGSGARG